MVALEVSPTPAISLLTLKLLTLFSVNVHVLKDETQGGAHIQYCSRFVVYSYHIGLTYDDNNFIITNPNITHTCKVNTALTQQQ